MNKFYRQLQLGVLCSVVGIIPAWAECTLPKKPADPPDGALLAQRDVDAVKTKPTDQKIDKPGLTEMAAALRSYNKYHNEVLAFRDCLNVETESLLDALGDDATVDEIKRVKEKQDARLNTVLEEETRIGAAYKTQREAYLAAAPK